MKFAELLELTPEPLRERIESLRKELFEARFKQATNQLEDTALFRRKRHEIAQMETALKQKQRQSQGEPAHV